MSRVESAFCRSAPWRLFTRRVVLPWALQGVEPVGHVLEIGAGSGAMAAELLATHPGITMTVTDFDEAMVATAADRLRRFGSRAEVRRADATDLPFPDARFDAVCSWIMLHHTVRWERALAEACRVLRPGGWLLAYDLLATRPARRVHELEGAYHRFMTLPELTARLAGLPLEDVVVRPTLGRALVRLRARRADGGDVATGRERARAHDPHGVGADPT
jgi:SAM-dependent methyltransferase